MKGVGGNVKVGPTNPFFFSVLDTRAGKMSVFMFCYVCCFLLCPWNFTNWCIAYKRSVRLLPRQR